MIYLRFLLLLSVFSYASFVDVRDRHVFLQANNENVFLSYESIQEDLYSTSFGADTDYLGVRLHKSNIDTKCSFLVGGNFKLVLGSEVGVQVSASDNAKALITFYEGNPSLIFNYSSSKAITQRHILINKTSYPILHGKKGGAALDLDSITAKLKEILMLHLHQMKIHLVKK